MSTRLPFVYVSIVMYSKNDCESGGVNNLGESKKSYNRETIYQIYISKMCEKHPWKSVILNKDATN